MPDTTLNERYVGRTGLVFPFEDLPLLLSNRIGLLISVDGLPFPEVVVEGIHRLGVGVECTLELLAHGLALVSNFVVIEERSVGILGRAWRQVFLVDHPQPRPEGAFVVD